MQIATKWSWTREKDAAALDCAEDKLSDQQIADRHNIARITLLRWKAHPAFQARMKEHVKAWHDKIMSTGIAMKANRVQRQHRDWQKLQQIVEERAADPKVADIPGGKTGHIVRTMKSVGFGENNELVEEFVVDTALMKELRALEETVEKSLGQMFPTKMEHSGPGGGAIPLTVEMFDAIADTETDSGN